MSTPEDEFYQACEQGREELARLILMIHPSLDINARHAIHRAARLRRTEMIDFLLLLGVKLDTFDFQDSTPLLLVLQDMRDEELKLVHLKKLLQAGASPNLGQKGNHPPLVHARTIEQANLLLEYGADVNYISRRDQWSVLMYYCDNRNLELIQLVLKHPKFKTINYQDRFHYTALIVALERRFPEVVNLLIQHGADYKLLSPSRRPILDVAAKEVKEVLRLAIIRQQKLQQQQQQQSASTRTIPQVIATATNNNTSQTAVMNLPQTTPVRGTEGNTNTAFSMKDRDAFQRRLEILERIVAEQAKEIQSLKQCLTAATTTRKP